MVFGIIPCLLLVQVKEHFLALSIPRAVGSRSQVRTAQQCYNGAVLPPTGTCELKTPSPSKRLSDSSRLQAVPRIAACLLCAYAHFYNDPSFHTRSRKQNIVNGITKHLWWAAMSQGWGQTNRGVKSAVTGHEYFYAVWNITKNLPFEPGRSQAGGRSALCHPLNFFLGRESSNNK